MHIKRFLSLAAVPAVWGQTQTLPELLAAQESTLSTLVTLLQSQPALFKTVAGLSNVTILAPSNDAFETLLADPAVAARATDPGFVAALLSYHVLKGTFPASTFLAADNAPVFVNTYLTNETYSTVKDGQVVEAQTLDGSVVVTSGNGTECTVVATDFNFTGGVVHVIDGVLSFPANLTTVLSQEDLTDLSAAVTTANLGATLTDLEQLTLFAPNNGAFDNIKDFASDLTTEQLTAVLSYHAVAGSVVYSTDIEDGATVQTVQGDDLTLSIRDGNVYINSAMIVKPNVLLKNGVVHIINDVLILEANSSSSGNSTDDDDGNVVPGMASGNKAVLGTVSLVSLVALFTLLL